MPYRFPLQAVLKLRQHKEEVEEQALAVLAGHRRQVELTLSRVRQQLQHWSAQGAERTLALGSGMTQHVAYAKLHMLQEAEQQLRTQLAELDVRRREREVKYVEARRAREVLSTLLEQQTTVHAASKARKEQQRMEDLFLGRYRR